MKPKVLNLMLIYIKDRIKAWILWYLVYTYRLGRPSNPFLTSTFPGNSGYRFIHPSSVTLKSEIRMSASTLTHNCKAKADSELQIIGPKVANRLALIVKSKKATYKYHLGEMYLGTMNLLESLGIKCKIVDGTMLESNLQNLPPSAEDFLIIVDNEMTLSEFNLVNDSLKNSKTRKLNGRIILLCYDLWREHDLDFIKNVANSIYRILHMDNVFVENFFPEQIKRKAYLWPMARFWSESRNYQHGNLQVENSVFFSGSVRQIDRREILDFLLKRLKSSNISSNFRIFDTLIPRSILKSSDYFHNLNSNSLILSLGQKSPTHWIMTGRTVEALIAPRSGALMQQEGPRCRPLSELLVPFRDYLSFSNSGELSDLIFFAEREPEKIAAIARSGRERIRRVFSDHELLTTLNF